MAVLSNDDVLKHITDKFGDKILAHETPYDLLTLTVCPSINVELVEFLRDDSMLNMNFLTDICGIHYPEQNGGELGIICHMHSFLNNYRLRLKFFVPEKAASIRTLIPLFPAANWMERETFDFYGIQFIGHPKMTRILNMEDMHYHPLLKQYPLEDGTREDKSDKYFGR